MTASEHETVNRLLAAYLDGEVTGAERKRVEAHLLTCEQCGGELDTLRRAQEKLRAAFKSATADANPSTEAWKELEVWISGGQRPSFTRSLANLVIRRARRRKKPGTGGRSTS